MEEANQEVKRKEREERRNKMKRNRRIMMRTVGRKRSWLMRRKGREEVARK